MSHLFVVAVRKFTDISYSTCYAIGVCSIFFYYSSWLYFFFASLEIYIVLKFKAFSSVRLRNIIYNISVIVISLCFLNIYVIMDSIGESDIGSCYIKAGSFAYIIDAAFNFTLMFLLLISYLMIKKQLGCCYGPAFHQLSKIILLVLISIFFNRVTNMVDFFWKDDYNQVIVTIALSLLIFSSIIVSLGRMQHPKVRSRIKEILHIKSSENNISLLSDDSFDKERVLNSILQLTLDGDLDDIADMLDHLGHKILVQILVLLTLRFRDYNEKQVFMPETINESRNTKEQKHYDSILYLDLSIELKMGFIEKVYCPDVSIIEYCPSIFRYIMKASNFDKDTMLKSLLSYDNIKALVKINNTGGRSNSFFYVSENQRIVIKTISSNEKSSFLKILPNYARRVIEDPSSLLVRIWGLFQILPHKQDFIIMENAIPDKEDCIIFDLKGSTVNRHVGGIDSENPPCGLVLKDLNFKRFGRPISISNKENIISTLIKDMKILKNNKLMDYSMLVGIYNKSVLTRYSIGENYSIAIIDFFQRYSYHKVLERIYKRHILRKSEGISVMSSAKYYRRIKNYIKSSVFSSEESS